MEPKSVVSILGLWYKLCLKSSVLFDSLFAEKREGFYHFYLVTGKFRAMLHGIKCACKIMDMLMFQFIVS